MRSRNIINRLARGLIDGRRLWIVYRDKGGRWTRRIIVIEELHVDHIIARCEKRDGAYRRFNLDSIRRVHRPGSPFRWFGPRVGE